MRILLSQEATLRISAVGENAISEIESSGPWGTSISPEISTVVDWFAVFAVVVPKSDMAAAIQGEGGRCLGSAKLKTYVW